MAVSEPNIYITNELYKFPFYWGEIDRIEAEAILKDQPNGSYLWKDPDQISQKGTFIEIAMKKNSKVIYDKILIGQMIGGVNISELLASLNNPVLRNRPFSLMELARNKICSPGITYEEISKLEIPKVLQEYLQEIWVKIICK